jgi:heme a synthase
MTADSSVRTFPSLALRRFAWGFLAYSIAVILWGTIVRATGSGAGCGDHWPLCDGTVVQHSHTTEHLIEFIHRITSGLSLIGVLLLTVWTWRSTERGHLARRAAIAALIFMILEAILGALLVVLGLTAQSQSPMRAPYLALHLTNTLLLIASITLTAHLLSRRSGFLRRDVVLIAPVLTIIGIFLFMIVGVSGSLAALGDTLFPAETLSTAMHQDFSDASNWLVRWRWTHPSVAILASIFLLWIMARAVRVSGPGKIWKNRPLTLFILGLLIVEYILGALNVALLAPVWMQVVHLLTADVLWVALVVLTARVTLMPRSAY